MNFLLLVKILTGLLSRFEIIDLFVSPCSWMQSGGPVTTESIVRFDTWFELFEVCRKKLAPMTLAKMAAEFVRSQNPKWPPAAIWKFNSKTSESVIYLWNEWIYLICDPHPKRILYIKCNIKQAKNTDIENSNG